MTELDYSALEKASDAEVAKVITARVRELNELMSWASASRDIRTDLSLNYGQRGNRSIPVLSFDVMKRL